MNHAQASINHGFAGQLAANGLKPEPPRTIASGAGRIDELNGRLGKLTESLSMISSQIGALSPVTGPAAGSRDTPAPSGAVYRLNNSADQAHMTLSDIENLVNGIARALG